METSERNAVFDPDALADIAENFVKRHKGDWSEDDWQEFLKEIRRSGLTLSPALVTRLPPLVETLKEILSPLSGIDFGVCSQVLDTAVAFVDRHEGTWSEADWQAYLAELRERGFDLSPETRLQLGNLLKSLALFYFRIPPERFRVLLDASIRFVERHRGAWNRDEWVVFLEELNAEGVDVTHRAQEFVGKLLEQLSRLYLKATEERLAYMVELAGYFIDEQEGVWDSPAWVRFLERLRQAGIELSHESQDCVAAILESMKSLYDVATATQGIEMRMADIARLTFKFGASHKWRWSDRDWRDFITEIRNNGIGLSTEMSNYLAGVAEEVRKGYENHTIATSGVLRQFARLFEFDVRQ